MAAIVITPDPSTANVDDEFGFSETITLNIQIHCYEK